jgi:diguanylate cyclase (GGDEF)-like protein
MSAGASTSTAPAATRPDPVPDTDPLTGLVPRRRLRDRMAEVLAGAPDPAMPPALLVLDLDRFKAVNDSAGHDTGDGVLQRVVRRIRGAVGPEAVVARTSGDEFAVFLPRGGAVTTLAAKLLDLVARPYAVNGHAITLSASIGVALWPADGKDADALLRAATIALHQAEAEGRNRQRAFEPSMQDRARLRLALETDLRAALALQQVELREALSLDQFVLHYQPQVELATGRLTGFEALLRWRHPVRGMVGPDDFIPLAETIGVIGVLGGWVLSTACQAAMRWPPSAHGTPLRVAVNLSPLQLREGRALVAGVADALAQSGLPPGRLEIEVTESAMAEDATDLLAEIHALGVSLAIDDFGTGFSSLSRIAQFPFDRIKIDRSFIRGIGAARRPGGGSDPAWMIRAIAALGAGLGVSTVAEGVETPAQARLVRDAGATEMQGYLVSRPVPEDAVAALIARLDAAPRPEDMPG